MTTIEHLLRLQPHDNEFLQLLCHKVARDIARIFLDVDIRAFLSDYGQLVELHSNVLHEVSILCPWTVIEKSKERHRNTVYSNKSTCVGCISVKEDPHFSRGLTLKEVPEFSTRKRFGLDDRHPPPVEVHFSTTAIDLICSLLLREDADGLLLLVSCDQKGRAVARHQATELLMRFVHIAFQEFPRMGEIATGIMSLIAIKHPTAFLLRGHDDDTLLTMS